MEIKQLEINRIRNRVDRLKSRFEKRLKKSFDKWQRRAIKHFMSEFNAPILTLSRELKNDLRVLLVNHYYSVTEAFVPGTSFERVKEVEEIPIHGSSPAEEETNNDSLLVPILIEDIEKKVGRQIDFGLPVHAAQILETTEQIANISRSFSLDTETGELSESETRAIMASKMAARSTTVAVTETQWPAESSQSIALEVTTPVMATATQGQLKELQKVSPNETLGSTNIDKLFAVGSAGAIDSFRRQLSNPKKMWVTMGDKRVRTSHDLVNGVTIAINQAFKLLGGLLMYPTDTSLGAPAREVAGCRCHAMYF